MVQSPRTEIVQMCDDLKAAAEGIVQRANPLRRIIQAEIAAVLQGGRINAYQGTFFTGLLQEPEYTSALVRTGRIARGLNPGGARSSKRASPSAAAERS